MSTFPERHQAMKYGLDKPDPEAKPAGGKRLSLDEVLTRISEIADDPENTDQFKALKALTSIQAATVTLPEPETDDDAIDRGARVMKCLGMVRSQLSYRKAFPSAKTLDTVAPRLTDQVLSKDEMTLANRCTSLPRLYKYIPELKRSGFPPGFPSGRGAAMQGDWCKKQAIQALIARRQYAVNEAVEEARTLDQSVREAPANDAGGSGPVVGVPEDENRASQVPGQGPVAE